MGQHVERAALVPAFVPRGWPGAQGSAPGCSTHSDPQQSVRPWLCLKPDPKSRMLCRSSSRWDSFTRFRRDAQGVVSRVGLLLLDEIHLLNDPHTLGEKLLAELRKSTERFETRLLMISLVSRLIGAHRLMLPGFYPYALRYLQPHQKEVTSVLASCVQAAHELVPPEAIAQWSDELWRRGRYMLIDRHDNARSRYCTEVLLARMVG